MTRVQKVQHAGREWLAIVTLLCVLVGTGIQVGSAVYSSGQYAARLDAAEKNIEALFDADKQLALEMRRQDEKIAERIHKHLEDGKKGE